MTRKSTKKSVQLNTISEGIKLPEELIRERAYEISQRDNCGDEKRNWFQALKELNGGK